MFITAYDIAKSLNNNILKVESILEDHPYYIKNLNYMLKYYGDTWQILVIFQKRSNKISRFDLFNPKEDQQIVLKNLEDWWDD